MCCHLRRLGLIGVACSVGFDAVLKMENRVEICRATIADHEAVLNYRDMNEEDRATICQ
jgi:hypothetical protein